MAWTTPKLFQEGEQLTARDLNLYLRDNLLENEVMKATTDGARLSADNQGNLVERKIAYDAIDGSETALNAHENPDGSRFLGPVNLGNIGPQVSVETGSRAIIFFSARIKSTSEDFDLTSNVGIDIPTSPNHRLQTDFLDAPTPNTASDFNIVKSTSPSVTCMYFAQGLTPGLNTFVLRYFLPIPYLDYTQNEFQGEYKDVTATYSNRHLLVIPL